MNLSDLEMVERQLKSSKGFEDFFGPEKEAKKNFHRLASMTHEDKYRDPELKQRAHTLFIKIHSLWEKAQKRMDNGTYAVKIPAVKKPNIDIWPKNADSFHRQNGRVEIRFSCGSLEEMLEHDIRFSCGSLEEMLEQMASYRR